jgi:recombination protein RecT
MSDQKGARASESTALAVKPIHALLSQYKPQIQQALPKHLTVDRLLRIANNTIQRSKGLKECSPMSLLACVVDAAQLGFEPDPIMGEVYFVPFKGTATIIIGYKGFEKLIYQAGEVYTLTIHVVRAGEPFHVRFGSRPELEHEPLPYPGEQNSDKWLGVYAVAHFRDGNTSFEFLNRDAVFARRARSQAWRQKKLDSPWFTNEEAMWKKTAVRAIAGRLPKSTTDHRLARAVVLDEAGEAGLLTPTPTGFELAAEEDRMLGSGEDPANGGDLQEAQEVHPPTKTEERAKPAGRGRGKKSAAPSPGNEIPKAKIPNEPIDVKNTAKDPVVKDTSKIYNRGLQAGWTVDAINSWIRKKFGIPMKEIRESMLPEIMKVMEAGT